MNRYEDRIKQLEQEVKEKQEEVELTNNQATIDILEEDIYNTKQICLTHFKIIGDTWYGLSY